MWWCEGEDVVCGGVRGEDVVCGGVKGRMWCGGVRGEDVGCGGGCVGCGVWMCGVGMVW